MILVIFLIFVLSAYVNAYTWDGSGNCNCSSNCSDCSNALNDTLNCNVSVVLTTNINSSTSCIDNPANFNNKVFDCTGHTIDGTGVNKGIHLVGNSNNTIKNCIITDFTCGIYLSSSPNNTLINNTANSNSYGFQLLGGSNNNTLINNAANNNDKYGLYISASGVSGNVINSNTFCSNNITDINNTGTSNSGNSNTCDTTYKWNDTGKTGCSNSCIQKPDLTVSNISYIPLNPAAGENVNFTVAIKNSGNSNLNLDEVNVTINITNNYFTDWKRVNLTNKTEINVTFNWTAALGLHNVSVAVDTNNEVNESDEGNNKLVITINLSASQNQSNTSLFILPPSTTQLQNATFNVTILINGTEMIGANFNLTFNSIILEALNITEGSFIAQCTNTTFNNLPQVINNTAGIIKFQNLCLKEGVSNVSGCGAVAVITFKAKSQGMTELKLNNANIFNTTGGPVMDISIQDGQVKVNTKPAANFTYAPEHPYTYINVLFNASLSTDNENITLYSWNFGDGSNATGITALHNYTTSGNYNVTLTVADNDNADDSITKQIYVNNTPPAAVISLPAEGYGTSVYTSILFVGNASFDIDGNITNYLWNFGDGSNATGNVTLHNYTTNGIYNVTLIVTDNFGMQNSTKITVYINNTPPSANAGPDINAYTRQNITFNASNSVDIDGIIVSYLWNFTEGTASSMKIASHTYNSCGIYNVSLTVTDNGGAGNKDSTTVTVYIAGDVTHNNAVDVFDLAKFAVAWRTNISNPGYNVNADFDGDGQITAVDFLRLIDNWEKQC